MSPGASVRPFWWSAALAVLLPAPLLGQSLEDRVRGAPDGKVRLSFAAREGVCGQGSQGITILDGDRDGEWESDCESGPVRVSLRMAGGRVREAETYVGGRWRAGPRHGTDLGSVPARQAADLLLTLAARASDEKPATSWIAPTARSG